MNEEIEKLQSFYDALITFAVNYSFQILGALAIIGAGAWIAAKVGQIVEDLMRGKEIDITLSRFTGGTVRMILLVLVIIIALGNLGISVTPLFALIGAAGLGVGLAIQGMLSNYAAGFTIIITRPFVVGDTIRVLDVAGLVTEVHLGYTILVDEDDVRIQVPNRLIVGEVLQNSSTQMLVELFIGVSYSSDTSKVKGLIEEALDKVDWPEGEAPLRAIVGIDNFGDSSINFGVRFWAPTTKHYQIRYAANQAIHEALVANKIEIPFPQREVRMLNG